MKKGILYGIGVGPGDPELITLKAVSLLQRIRIIFAPFSSKNSYSLALDVISNFVRKDAKIIKLPFPMTKERKILEEAWKRNAEVIVSYLKRGEDSAFITLGDPMTYSTFGYIKEVIEKRYPEIEIKVIPGITSYHAAAASAKKILAKSDESFIVVSGSAGLEKLKKMLFFADHIVMLKVYKNFPKIKSILKELKLIDKAVLVERCGFEDEKITADLNKEINPSYLSILIIDKGSDL